MIKHEGDATYNYCNHCGKVRINFSDMYCEKCIGLDLSNRKGLSSCCAKEIIIRLMPDYSSSGLWCFHCGCGTGRPDISYPEIPVGLIQTIEMWNALWEYRSTGTVHYIKNIFKDMFIESGRYLCEQINQYYPCYFDCDEKVIFYDLDNLKE